MRLTVLSAFVLLTACVGPELKNEQTTQTAGELNPGQAQTLTADAEVLNALPYDGCSYPITIAGVRHAASPNTQALVAAFAQEKLGTTLVRVEYRLTGRTATVECGWGSQQSHPELEVLSIVARPPVTAAASIENGLPYDGCSYAVTIDGVAYAPSPASRPRVASFAQSIGHIPARVEYVVTGGTASVECGWGSQRSLPEIDVISVSAP